MKRPWAAVVWAAVFAAAGCGNEGAGKAAAKVPVAVVYAAKAEKGMLPVTVRTVGQVEPLAEIMLRPQASGQVTETPVVEGTEVQAGDELVVLDERPWLAALKEAEADLARDRARAADDRRTANQFAAAIANSAASKTEADSAEARAQSSEAQVVADEAAVQVAKLNVEYCRIRAPFAGRIGSFLVKKGAIVKANETDLVSLAQLKPIQAAFSVPEKFLEPIREQQRRASLDVRVNTGAPGSKDQMGRLSFIDNKADAGTGTIRLKALFANADETLWPGLFVNVVLTISLEEGVVVPAEAVQVAQRGPAVWVVKADQTVELRPVTVARTVDGRSMVAGIEDGETVVTEGQLRLAPGAKVDVKAREGSKATAAEGMTDKGAS
jgi:multidrug efflux system membrane fusion protein